MTDYTQTTLTLDQIDRFERYTGLKYEYTHKLCDFCGKRLPVDHPSKQCTSCPTVFDECERCKGHDICHKPHDIDYDERCIEEVQNTAREMEMCRILGMSLRQRWDMMSDDRDDDDDDDDDENFYQPPVDVTESLTELAEENDCPNELKSIANGGYKMVMTGRKDATLFTLYKRTLSGEESNYTHSANLALKLKVFMNGRYSGNKYLIAEILKEEIDVSLFDFHTMI